VDNVSELFSRLFQKMGRHAGWSGACRRSCTVR
jgi:hypothetical protein